MARKRSIRGLVILGRRWFRRTYGNTYTSVQIKDKQGATIAKLGPTGGYGDHYLTMALEWLAANGYAIGRDPQGRLPVPWQVLKGRASYEVVDVARERDL